MKIFRVKLNGDGGIAVLHEDGTKKWLVNGQFITSALPLNINGDYWYFKGQLHLGKPKIPDEIRCVKSHSWLAY